MNKIPIEQRLQQIRSQTQQAPQSGVRVPIEERLAQLRSQPKKEPTIEQQKQVIQTQGQPVSVRKDRTQPTLVGGIIRDIVKQPIKAALTIARPFVDPIGKKSGLSVNTKYLGNVGDYGTEIEKSTNNLANKYKAGEISLGRAALGGAGAGALQAMDFAAVAPVGKVASQAIRGTVKQSLVPTLKAAAKESLIRGGAVGAGYDVSSQLASGEKYNPLQTVAAGTVGTVADLGLSYGLPKAISGTKSFAKNNLTKAGRDAKLTRKVEEELFNIENNYAKLRKNQKYSKDANTATRKRIVTTGVLDDAVDTNGTINADNAIKKYRDASGLSGKEGVVRQNLERLGEKLNIKDAEKQLTDTVYTSGLEGAELRTALNNVKKEVSGYRLRADADGNLPLTFFHDAKIGTTNSIDFNTPADIKAYKKTLASGLKDIVENNSQFNVKEVNKELSPLFKDIEYLESLNGRKVKGGKLGKYASQVTGNIVGGVAGGAIGGFPGSAIGTVVGGEVGSALRGSSLSKVLRGPGTKELPVSKVLQKAAATAKSPRLGLPEPKPGLPKSQNFVPIELPGVKEPVYRSPRIAGNTTQYTNIPNTKPKNIDIPTQLPKSKVKSSDLSTEAKKYKSAEEFVDKFYEVTDSLNKNPVSGTDMANRSVDREFKLKVLKHLQSPEVEKLYQKGMKDKEILTDFYRKTINDLNKKPKLLRKDFNSSEEYLKAFNERVKPIDDLTKKELPKKKGIIGNAIDTLKTLKDKNVRERGSISLESILPESKSVGSRGVSLTKNTTEDLIQQAKKYKSAEEFVKAHETTGNVGTSFSRSTIFEKYPDIYQKNRMNIKPNAADKYDFHLSPLTNENFKLSNFENAEGFYKKPKIMKDLDGNTFAYLTKPFEKLGKQEKWNLRKVYDSTSKSEKPVFITEDGGKTFFTAENEVIGTGKTKSQLEELWNKANKKVAVELPTGLVQQAKKYKSAEEFIKNTIPSYGKPPGNPLYHGTSANIKSGKLTFGAGDGAKKGGQSGGHFLSDSKQVSEVFAGNNGKVYIVDPSYKKNILDLTQPKGVKEFENYIGNKYKTYDGESLEFTKDDFDIMFPNGKTDFASISQYPELVEQMTKRKGYTGIAFDEYAGSNTAKTYQILHSDNIPVIEQSKISNSDLSRLIKEKIKAETDATDLRLEEYGRNQDGYLTDSQIEELDYLEKRIREIDNILLSSDYKSQLTDIWNKANKKILPKNTKLIRNKDGSVEYGSQKMSGDFKGMPDIEIIKMFDNTPF